MKNTILNAEQQMMRLENEAELILRKCNEKQGTGEFGFWRGVALGFRHAVESEHDTDFARQVLERVSERAGIEIPDAYPGLIVSDGGFRPQI